jgi:hypothetical protein
MKLIDLMNEAFEAFNVTELKGKSLELLKDKVLQCEELKYVRNLDIISNPNDQEIKLFKSVKITDSYSLPENCTLFSISILNDGFNGEDFLSHCRQKPVISPLQYDPVDFTPYRLICFRISTEILNDNDFFCHQYGNKKNEYRSELHNVLDKLLNNPKEHESPMNKNIIVKYINQNLIR